MATLVQWAKAQRKLMELQASELAKDLTDKEIVELVVAFPYYKQSGVYKVGDIRRDPKNDQPKQCKIEYDADVQTAWTIDDGTLWYAYHGISKETAYPWVAPTGAHDIYKAGQWMTYTDGSVYECVKDTNYSPQDLPDAWKKHE